MRLNQWQRDPIRVQKTQELIHSEFFKDLMQMVKDESPWSTEHPGPGSTELDMARLWERGFGVNFTLNLFELAAVSAKEPKVIPQNYTQNPKEEEHE